MAVLLIVFICIRRKPCAITTKEQYDHNLFCPLGHPGLRRTADSEIMGLVVPCAVQYFKYTSHFVGGNFFYIFCKTATASFVRFISLCYPRGPNPRLNLIVLATFDEATGRLSADIAASCRRSTGQWLFRLLVCCFGMHCQVSLNKECVPGLLFTADDRISDAEFICEDFRRREYWTHGECLGPREFGAWVERIRAYWIALRNLQGSRSRIIACFSKILNSLQVHGA